MLEGPLSTSRPEVSPWWRTQLRLQGLCCPTTASAELQRPSPTFLPGNCRATCVDGTQALSGLPLHPHLSSGPPSAHLVSELSQCPVANSGLVLGGCLSGVQLSTTPGGPGDAAAAAHAQPSSSSPEGKPSPREEQGLFKATPVHGEPPPPCLPAPSLSTRSIWKAHSKEGRVCWPVIS